MNIAEVQSLSTTLVEQYSNDAHAPEVSHSSSSKGLVYTLRVKRSRHVSETTRRGNAGYHTFAIHVGFDDTCTIAMTRKVVDEESGVPETIEASAAPMSLDEISTMFADWHATISDVEHKSELSRKNASPATAMPETKQKAEPKAAPVEAAPAPEATTPVTDEAPEDPFPSSLRRDDPKSKDLDLRYYLTQGDFYVIKVRGEFTDDELIDLGLLDAPTTYAKD